MSNQNLVTNWQECIFCSYPADIKEVKFGKITYECSACGKEFSITEYRNMTAEENEAYKKFIEKFFDEMEDPDPEIAKVVNENFFDLL